MTTVVELTPEEWTQLQQFTQSDDPTSAATAAIREYIRFAKRRRLIELSEQIEMDDNWSELEEYRVGDAVP
jgi:hypothetical protein